MTDNLRLLEEKVGQVLERLESIKSENEALHGENKGLVKSMAALQQEFQQFRLDHNDQAEQVKTRLIALLGRIEELEKIGL